MVPLLLNPAERCKIILAVGRKIDQIDIGPCYDCATPSQNKNVQGELRRGPKSI
jgi:hypothetical protein